MWHPTRPGPPRARLEPAWGQLLQQPTGAPPRGDPRRAVPERQVRRAAAPKPAGEEGQGLGAGAKRLARGFGKMGGGGGGGSGEETK